MDIPNILKFMHPDAVWSVGEDYDSLVWPEQEFEKPTLQQIKDAELLYQIKQLITDFGLAIQKHIESTAHAKQYESSLHCASYVASANEAWKLESQTFIDWRDKCWEYAYMVEAKVKAGDKAPTVDEFIAGTPAISWQ